MHRTLKFVTFMREKHSFSAVSAVCNLLVL